MRILFSDVSMDSQHRELASTVTRGGWVSFGAILAQEEAVRSGGILPFPQAVSTGTTKEGILAAFLVLWREILDMLEQALSVLRAKAGSTSADRQPRVGVVQVVRLEQEQTSVAASGQVRTSDGRSVGFQLSVNLERMDRWAASGEVSLQDPLVVNFDGPAARLEGTRMAFDLDGDSVPEALPTLARGSGFLVFDRNGNGRADNGRELFGASLGQGFSDLATLDTDRNGWIDEGDPAFGSLRIWAPGSAGAWAKPGDLGIGAFYTGAVSSPFLERDGDGQVLGQIRATGLFLREDGRAGSLQQVDLATGPRAS